MQLAGRNDFNDFCGAQHFMSSNILSAYWMIFFITELIESRLRRPGSMIEFP
jgi:hypothetical protein